MDALLYHNFMVNIKVMTDEEIKDNNSEHKDISHSTYLHPYINSTEEIIDWGLTKLGGGLQTVELT